MGSPEQRTYRQSRYGEKLKDPRWQKLRLLVFERDRFSCQWCDAADRTLAVHHLSYRPDTEPWDYPLENFLTLCEPCHSEDFQVRPGIEREILDALKGVSPRSLVDLKAAIDTMNVPATVEMFVIAACAVARCGGERDRLFDAFWAWSKDPSKPLEEHLR